MVFFDPAKGRLKRRSRESKVYKVRKVHQVQEEDAKTAKTKKPDAKSGFRIIYIKFKVIWNDKKRGFTLLDKFEIS